MGYIVKMPKLGMSMQEGILLEWYADVGETVEEGDVLVEIESEKTSAEVAASESGVLRRIYAEPGDAVKPNLALGIVADADADIADLEAQVDATPVAAEADDGAPAAAADDSPDSPETPAAPDGTSERVKASPKARKRARDLGVDLSAAAPNDAGVVTAAAVETAAAEASSSAEAPSSTEPSSPKPAPGTQPGPGEPRATPKARKLARERGIDLATVATGEAGGAITAATVEAATRRATSDESAPSATPGEAGGTDDYEARELSSMRRTIADRLGKSYREAPHVTVSRTVPVDELLRARSVADDYLEDGASIMDVLLVLVSATLSEHSAFNATFEDDVHRVYRSHNVGVAVDIDRGLITPVVSDVGSRGLASIAAERKRLTDRALNDEFTADDLSGGTFTVSNLGVLGVDSFTPIINPPQVAILGVNRTRERPTRTADGVGFETVMTVDLSFDHRVVDGADAARFLDTLAGHMTDPWTPLLDRL